MSSPHVNPSARVSTRSRKPPEYLQDYHCHLANFDILLCIWLSPKAELILRTYVNTSHKIKFLQLTKLSLFLLHFTMNSFFSQAVKCPEWQDFINAEIKALELNNTWTLVDLPPCKVPIGCKSIKSNIELMDP